MKEDRLFQILGQVDEDLIDSAGQGRAAKPGKPLLLKLGAAAACLALMIGGGFFLKSFLASESVPGGRLPQLTIDFENGGMGFEGYCAYDIGELVGENPWNEGSKIPHLPVIQNTLTYNGMQRVNKPDLDAMKVLLLETAASLGLDTENLPVTDNVPDEETRKKITEKLTIGGGEVPEGYFDASAVLMSDGNIEVEVDASMTVTVRFEPAVSLPADLNFTHGASYEDLQKVAAYLLEEYRDYLNMEHPKINIQGGDYTFEGNQMFQVTFYDEAGDETQRILNYNFNTVTFSCNDEGKLFLSRACHPDLSNVVGNYPIISADEALELLESRNYITTAPEEFPGMEYVRKVELIYRSGSREKIYMPYYRIYVELPDMDLDNGLHNYGAYYVPAVEGTYIENMPVWDGEFN